jgi:hypothetical protein
MDADLHPVIAALASIEFKTHAGPSFGNNFSNRVEEALENAWGGGRSST